MLVDKIVKTNIVFDSIHFDLDKLRVVGAANLTQESGSWIQANFAYDFYDKSISFITHSEVISERIGTLTIGQQVASDLCKEIVNMTDEQYDLLFASVHDQNQKQWYKDKIMSVVIDKVETFVEEAVEEDDDEEDEKACEEYMQSISSNELKLSADESSTCFNILTDYKYAHTSHNEEEK